MGIARSSGLQVAYERVGDGAPLVFEWPQLSGLADEFTVVAWDEPGAGRSSTVSRATSRLLLRAGIERT